MQTSIRIDAGNRDALARIAADDFGGITLDETVALLTFEHECHTALARMTSEQRQDYLAEADQLADASLGIEE